MAEQDFTAAELRARLEHIRARIHESRIAAITRKGYVYDWRIFESFCQRIGEPSMPATADTIALYVTDQLETGHKVVTARRRVAAIVRMHREAGYDSPVTSDILNLFRCARRTRTEPPRQMAALTLEELRAMSAALAKSGAAMDLRDRAVLIVGFASALRRSNLAALQLSDAEFASNGLVLHIRRSKTDQEGRGQLLGLPHGKHSDTCPVTCLRAWLAVRGSAPGPLFSRVRSSVKFKADRPLNGSRFWVIVKRALKLAGLDATLRGAHSLRAGFITAAGEAGLGELIISAQSGHRNMATLRKYFRRVDLWRDNPCKSIDL